MTTTVNKAVVLHVKVADVIVGERRRQDYGDIDELAANIAKRGLLHPIVIDDDEQMHLVAGGRRLEAVKRLEWAMVPARLLGELTEAERREIELEENIHRKNLTRDEVLKNFDLAKQILRDRAEAEEVSSNLDETSNGSPEGDFSPQLRRKIGRGRPSNPDSDERAATLAKTSVDTVKRHQQHAAAEDRYPILKTVPTQADALKIAAKLDAMPEPVRAETIVKLEQNDPVVGAALTDRPPVPKGLTPHEEAISDPARKWAHILHDIAQQLSSLRARGGIGTLTRTWSKGDKRAYLARIREVQTQLAEWEEYLIGEVEHGEHVA